jgi:glutaredoxin
VEQASFKGLNTQVLGISVDHVPCLQAWAESVGGIHYPLLSDFWPHGAVASLYGVLRTSEGFSERALFVIDAEGIIRYMDIHDIDDRPDNQVLLNVLRELHGASQVRAQAESAGVYLDEPEAAAIPAGDIILYCARWCKDCRKAKAWLDERSLSYVEVDIDSNMAARNQVRKWGGGFLVTPVIDFDGAIILDYDPARLEEALNRRNQ